KRRVTSWEKPHDHPPREGAVPRRWDHEGRTGPVLRGRCADHAATYPPPSGNDGTLSVRHRPAGLHAEGRLERLPGLARARRGAEERRNRPPSARERLTVAPLAREPELHHAARLDLSHHEPLSPRHLRLRSRSI